MLDFEEISFARRDPTSNKHFLECPSPTMDLLLSANSDTLSLSFQEMIDVDIRSEIETVLGHSDFNFSEIGTLSNEFDNETSLNSFDHFNKNNLNNENFFSNNKDSFCDFLSGEALMVNPNSVMPLAIMPIKTTQPIKKIDEKKNKMDEDNDNELNLNLNRGIKPSTIKVNSGINLTSNQNPAPKTNGTPNNPLLKKRVNDGLNFNDDLNSDDEIHLNTGIKTKNNPTIKNGSKFNPLIKNNPLVKTNGLLKSNSGLSLTNSGLKINNGLKSNNGLTNSNLKSNNSLTNSGLKTNNGLTNSGLKTTNGLANPGLKTTNGLTNSGLKSTNGLSNSGLKSNNGLVNPGLKSNSGLANPGLKSSLMVKTGSRSPSLKTNSPQLKFNSGLKSNPTLKSNFYTTKSYLNGSKTNENRVFPKPAYSYSCLIAMALKNSKSGSLPVSEIYNFMIKHFPYFKTAPTGWKNSVRHNLSLNKCFEKIEKPTQMSGQARKGCLWAMNPSKIGKMDEEVQKWSRKDPSAIRKAMVNPETLEALERGELKYSYASEDSSYDSNPESNDEESNEEQSDVEIELENANDHYDNDDNEENVDFIDINDIKVDDDEEEINFDIEVADLYENNQDTDTEQNLLRVEMALAEQELLEYENCSNLLQNSKKRSRSILEMDEDHRILDIQNGRRKNAYIFMD